MANQLVRIGVGAQHAAPLRCVWIFAALIALLSSCASTPSKQAAPTSPLTIVEHYLSALTRRDLLMLTAYVVPDVTWYSVVKGERITEVTGRAALTTSLTNYFASTQQTEWAIEQAVVVGQTVAVRERSQWRADDGNGERVSLAVYEIVDGRIARITYFLDTN
jgi:limonene-1,2-epoxide hydrolase